MDRERSTADLHVHSGNNQRMGDNGQEHMLIFNVQVVKGVNEVSSPAIEKFEGLEKIRQVVGRCFYSVTEGFVTCPTITDRQFGVSVLCSTVKPSKFPVRVIERRAEIVDGIADDRRQNGWQVAAKLDGKSGLPAFTALVNGDGVRVLLGETSKGLFEIADVMLGPFDL